LDDEIKRFIPGKIAIQASRETRMGVGIAAIARVMMKADNITGCVMPRLSCQPSWFFQELAIRMT
jgi:hypothetical protein